MHVCNDGVTVLVGVIDGDTVGVTEGVLTGVTDGVIVYEIVGVTEGVGDTDCVYEGVICGVGRGAITCTVFNNCGKLVILIFAVLIIAALFCYKHSNTLVKTCGAVCSFMFIKQSLLNIVLSVFLSSTVNATISPDVIISLTGFNVPENLNAR